MLRFAPRRCPGIRDAGVVVLVTGEIDALGLTERAQADGDVLPVDLVIEEQRAFVVRIEEPVLNVDAAIRARIHVHVRGPLLRYLAARARLELRVRPWRRASREP